MDGQEQPKPCRFNHWAKFNLWRVEHAAFILLGVEPPKYPHEAKEQTSYHRGWAFIFRDYEDLLALIEDAIQSDNLRVEAGWENTEFGGYSFNQVPVIDLMIWAKQKNIQIPEELEAWLAEQMDTVAGSAPNSDGWDGFDPDSPTYPRGLDIALQAWRAVSQQQPDARNPKPLILAWIDEHCSDFNFTITEKKRIATICNWNKAGGRDAKE